MVFLEQSRVTRMFFFRHPQRLELTFVPFCMRYAFCKCVNLEIEGSEKLKRVSLFLLMAFAVRMHRYYAQILIFLFHLSS